MCVVRHRRQRVDWCTRVWGGGAKRRLRKCNFIAFEGVGGDAKKHLKQKRISPPPSQAPWVATAPLVHSCTNITPLSGIRWTVRREKKQKAEKKKLQKNWKLYLVRIGRGKYNASIETVCMFHSQMKWRIDVKKKKFFW